MVNTSLVPRLHTVDSGIAAHTVSLVLTGAYDDRRADEAFQEATLRIMKLWGISLHSNCCYSPTPVYPSVCVYGMMQVV